MQEWCTWSYVEPEATPTNRSYGTSQITPPGRLIRVEIAIVCSWINTFYSMNSGLHHRADKSQTIPVHTNQLSPFRNSLNIMILSACTYKTIFSTPRFDHNSAQISDLSFSYCTYHSSDAHWHHHPNNFRGNLRIMKLLFKQMSLFSCYFLCFTSEYISKHPVIKHSPTYLTP